MNYRYIYKEKDMNINRFKMLLEASMGNVKPLIVEDDHEKVVDKIIYDLKTGQQKIGTYTGDMVGAHMDGQGTFTNKNGVVFSGTWEAGAADDDFIKSNSEENKQWEGYRVSELAEIQKDQNSNKSSCTKPHLESKSWFSYPGDKNYMYHKDTSGICWWAKNKKNNKIFNLTELVKTKPNIQSSIDKLNELESSNSGTSSDDNNLLTNNQSESNPCPYGMGRLATKEEVEKLKAGEPVEVFINLKSNLMLPSNSSIGPNNVSGLIGAGGGYFGFTTWRCERNNEVTYFFQPPKPELNSGSSQSTLTQTGGEDLKLSDAEYVKLTS